MKSKYTRAVQKACIIRKRMARAKLLLDELTGLTLADDILISGTGEHFLMLASSNLRTSLQNIDWFFQWCIENPLCAPCNGVPANDVE